MAQQDKQMRVGACKGCAYNLAIWFYWLTVTGMRLIIIVFFLVIKPSIHFGYSIVLSQSKPALSLSLSTQTIFDTHLLM
jgi:hypothetical protein